MLFMKEQRPKIAAEYTLKESAAINQILGKRVCIIYWSLNQSIFLFQGQSNLFFQIKLTNS